MTQDQTYNGWSNRETWLVNLWLENEFSCYETVKAMAKDAGSSFALADRIRPYVEVGMIPERHASLASDLLTTAVSRVDWDEVARSWFEEYHDSVEG